MKKMFHLVTPAILLCCLAAVCGILTGTLTAGFGRILLWIGTVRTWSNSFHDMALYTIRIQNLLYTIFRQESSIFCKFLAKRPNFG